MAHAVDLPVTNLDEDEDDFSQEELNPRVLREDFDIEDEVLRPASWWVWDKLSRWTQRSYKRIPDAIATSGIELRAQFRDDDSFDLSDEEFMLRRQKGAIFENVLRVAKKVTVWFLLLALLVTVIVLGVLLGKNGKSKRFSKLSFSNGTDLFHPTTILISLDGFHPHYISEELTPTLHSLLLHGYGAPYMIPSFPSSTFPNHWTMATGLYPQYHGIVGNKFYDPFLEKEFINVIPGKSLDPVFWGGEPIWTTAELQGVRSAIHMFPGSEVVFPKGNPSEVDKFNSTELLEIKTQRILGWLDRPVKKRPELIIGYIPTIDTLGHHYGVKGPEIEQGLQYVDSFVKNLTKGIEERNATDIVNLIIVSDHGMAPTSNDRLIYLDELVNITKIQYNDGWPLFGLRPYPEYSVEEVYSELEANFVEQQGYKIYLRENLPKEWNFGGDPHGVKHEYYERVAPIWVVPDIGYSITTHDDMERKHQDYAPKGVHGYNNSEVLMRALFVGSGPYFRERGSAYKIKPFHNVEVYNILCEILHLMPAVNNGTSNLFSLDNVLPENWKDQEDYPGVEFDLGGMLKQDSTYDALFRAKISGTTTLYGDMEQTVSGGTTDGPEVDPVESEEEVNEENGKTDDQGSGKLDQSEDNSDEDKPEHKGIWGAIEDFGEDLIEDASELIDDVGDAIEEFGEEIEESYHEIVDKHDD